MKIRNHAHICLDASVMEDGTLGIGIYDITNNKKIALTFKTEPSRNALKGETMALICAMEYAHNLGIKKVHFFTDNLTLSEMGIDANFLIKFPFKETKLTWIPRDLNKEADKMSKAGRNPNSGHWNEAANQTDKPVKKEQENVKQMFEKYSYDQKVKFLSKMAKSTTEKEVIRMLETGTKDNYGFCNDAHSKVILSMAKSIFIGEEAPQYVRKRLNKMNVKKLDSKRFISEYTVRKEA